MAERGENVSDTSDVATSDLCRSNTPLPSPSSISSPHHDTHKIHEPMPQHPQQILHHHHFFDALGEEQWHHFYYKDRIVHHFLDKDGNVKITHTVVRGDGEEQQGDRAGKRQKTD